MGLLAGIVLLLILASCGGAAATPTPTATTAFAPGAAPFTLITSAFPDAGPIPKRYTCDGEDTSPPFSWTGAPSETESFVVIMDDPDAPGGTWTHWVVYDIPADRLGLKEGQPRVAALPGGGIHGKNSWGDRRYGGPCPHKGPAHKYRIFLYAVDTVLELPSGASKDDVLDALEGHILAESLLTGTYGR